MRELIREKITTIISGWAIRLMNVGVSVWHDYINILEMINPLTAGAAYIRAFIFY